MKDNTRKNENDNGGGLAPDDAPAVVKAIVPPIEMLHGALGQMAMAGCETAVIVSAPHAGALAAKGGDNCPHNVSLPVAIVAALCGGYTLAELEEFARFAEGFIKRHRARRDAETGDYAAPFVHVENSLREHLGDAGDSLKEEGNT